jgi:histidine triad (HIT) family protein
MVTMMRGELQVTEACIFCAIIERRLPAKIVFEDDGIVAFEDTHPQAPVHILIVPRKHLASLEDASSEDTPLLGRLFAVAAQLARERGLEAKGYRTVMNTGSWAGQSVFHVHLHVMGGRVFRWPPG